MRSLAGMALLGVVSLATPAFSQENISGALELQLSRNTDVSNNSKRIAMQFDLGLSERTSLQFDLGAAKYEDTWSTSPSVAMHFTYDLSPEVTLAGFLAGDDTRPGNYFYYGTELRYQTDALDIQGYVAGIDVIKSDAAGVRYGVDAEIDLGWFDKINLVSGLHGQTLSGDEKTYGYLGTVYSFSNNMDLTMTVGQTGQKETIVSTMLTIPFGGGATFGQRDSRSVFPAY